MHKTDAEYQTILEQAEVVTEEYGKIPCALSTAPKMAPGVRVQDSYCVRRRDMPLRPILPTPPLPAEVVYLFPLIYMPMQ